MKFQPEPIDNLSDQDLMDRAHKAYAGAGRWVAAGIYSDLLVERRNSQARAEELADYARRCEVEVRRRRMAQHDTENAQQSLPIGTDHG